MSSDAVPASTGFPRRRIFPAVVLLPAFLSLGGCADAGAPSFALFGAYFPAWMFCATIGIVGAALARAVFVGTGLVAVLPYQLLLCTAVGTIMALAAWLVAFGG